MNKTTITEEMKVHESWYKEAREITLEKLPEFLRKLTEDYHHDYGTICHALAAGAIATAWAMNGTPTGGITGFQAGGVMWEFICHWNYSGNKTGLRIVDYDNMLYPQYEDKFDKTIEKGIWESLQAEAKNLLAQNNNNTVHERVYEHWESIANGVVPFGYSVEEE